MKSAIRRWAKITELIDAYREAHEALFKFRKTYTSREVTEMLMGLGNAFQTKTCEFSGIFRSEQKKQAESTQPVFMKLLYAKENGEYEIHLELERLP